MGKSTCRWRAPSRCGLDFNDAYRHLTAERRRLSFRSLDSDLDALGDTFE